MKKKSKKKSSVLRFYLTDCDRDAADRILSEAVPLLLAAVDFQRSLGRPGQAYKVAGEWVVSVGDRAAGKKQGLRMDADYYAIAYPITSEPAAYVLRELARQKDAIRLSE